MSIPSASPTIRKRRGRSRSDKQNIRRAVNWHMLPSLRRGLPLTEPLSPQEIEKIDDASLAILEDVGVDFRDAIALQQWREAGAEVSGERVRMDRGLIRELIKTIPSKWTYHARNPNNNLPFGGPHSIFIPMTGAPFIRDLEGVRRNPTLNDLANFHKLSQMSPALHSSAHHIVEPMDHAVAHRHLRITYSSMKYSDKTFMGMTTSGKNGEDVMRMCEILFGKDFVAQHAVTTGNINGNSPLVWDETMLGACRAFVKRKQPVLCSPFVLGGANTPASVVPTLAQLNAEALSALAYTQICQPGARAIYGHFLSTVSMRSGAPMAGTPEISLMNFMVGQMARYYNIPWRTSNNLGGAKTFDAQAGYESTMTMNACLMAGAHYIWHSAGWNEAGMHCCMAKFVVDAEMCEMGYRMAEGLRWDDFEEGLAAIRDIGPGGHYLGHAHTLANFERAFYMPKLFDNNSIEQWQAEGAHDLVSRAVSYASKQLADYEEPALDPAIDEALLDFIARREQEIPIDQGLNEDY